MMRTLIIAAIILAAFGTLEAQDPTEDRLAKEFYDTLSYSAEDYEVSRKHSERLYQLGRNSNDPGVMARGLMRLAYLELYFNKWGNDWEKKLARCEVLCEQPGTIHRAEFLMFRGHIKGKWQGNQKDGLSEIEEALTIARQLEHDVTLSQAYSLGADLLLLLGQANRAMDFALRAAEIAEHADHRASLAQALFFATAIANEKSPELAEPYARRLIALDPKSPIGQAVVAEVEAPDGVEERLREKIMHIERQDKIRMVEHEQLGNLRFDLAKCLWQQQKHEQAIAEWEKSRDNYRHAKNPTSKANTVLHIFFARRELGIPHPNADGFAEAVRAYSGRTNTSRLCSEIQMVWEQLGMTKEAQEWKERAERQRPKEVGAALHEISLNAKNFWRDELRVRELNSSLRQQRESANRARTGWIVVISLISFGLIIYKAASSQRALSRLQVEIDRKEKAQAESEELRSQLLRTQRLDAVGTLAAGVAHDFNNTLGAVMGYCELIKADMHSADRPENRTNVKYLNAILDAVADGANLSRSLLTFSVGRVDEKATTDIGQLIGDSQSFFRRVLPASIDLSVSISQGNSLNCLVDPSQIKQAVLNLVINARDAITDGGRIDVSVELDPIIADSVLISVADNGCGIDDEAQQRIFDPFYTTKERGQGTGLGLSIVHGVVEAHGGAITIDSRFGRGTTVRIQLPVVDSQPMKQRDRLEIMVNGGGRRVLVVEDDDKLRNAIEGQLKRAGYCVTSSADGIEAMHIVSRRSCELDVILLDIDLPLMRGDEVRHQMRTNGIDIPTIMMTGLASMQHDDLILRKPFRESELLRAVHSV